MRWREALDDEEELDLLADLLSGPTKEEAGFFAEELSRLEAHDLKPGAVKYFLTEHRSGGGPAWMHCLYYGTVLRLSYQQPFRAN